MNETNRIARAVGRALRGLLPSSDRGEFALRFAEELGIRSADEKAPFVRRILEATLEQD